MLGCLVRGFLILSGAFVFIMSATYLVLNLPNVGWSPVVMLISGFVLFLVLRIRTPSRISEDTPPQVHSCNVCGGSGYRYGAGGYVIQCFH